MKKVVAIALFSVLMTSACSGRVLGQSDSLEQFFEGSENFDILADWCPNTNRFILEPRYRGELPIDEVGRWRCDGTENNFTNLTEFDLSENPIEGVTIFASPSNVSYLDSYENPMEEIEPLESLIDGSYLDSYENPMEEIEPLESLTDVSYLDSYENPMEEIEPLGGLTNLPLITILLAGLVGLISGLKVKNIGQSVTGLIVIILVMIFFPNFASIALFFLYVGIGHVFGSAIGSLREK
ncbi:MAG: hypothetical protein AB4290_21925 [Spirulina sp.]